MGETKEPIAKARRPAGQAPTASEHAMTKISTASAILALRLPRFAQLPRRALALATALPLLVLLVMAHGAGAQPAHPPGVPLDPPGSVARLNLAEGAVSFAPAEAGPDANAWTAAVLNRPLTTGDRLWTGPRARSELHVGSTAVRMNDQTSLDFLALDDNLAQLRVAQGSVQLRVRTLFEGQRLEVDTPNLALVISEPGDYRVDVNAAGNTTRVVALSGSGVLYGDNGAALTLGRQQQGNFSGTNLTPAAPGAAFQDGFDAWAAARDRREDQSVSARYIPRETMGYQQLDSYGDWQQDPGYGAVWLPRAVPTNWAPYRDGHWSWIAPWGWTWVDDAPWGFAPFHYGRWARIGPRWAWVPGHLPRRPVYAPALVAFVGGNSGGINWNISIGSGSAPQPGVGWFPLAPGEAFRPVYRASPRYITQVNNNIVVNNAVNITNNYRFQHQPAAVTAVSRDDFFRGRPMQGNRHALSPAELERAQLLVDRNALPQRPEAHERPRQAPAAALPPAAVVLQPVIRSREERGQDRRGGPERIDPRAARPENNDRNPRAQAVPAVPAAAAALPPAMRPLAAPVPERAGEADQRARHEQAQRQTEQARQQAEQGRQQDQQRRQAQEAQVQHQSEQARQQAELARQQDVQRRQNEAQQQGQRDQQRQQAEQGRQQDQQRRQAQEAQLQLQTEQARQQGELARQQDAQRRQSEAQQQSQRDQQRQQAEQLRQQDQQRHQAEQAQAQRAQREQAQRQTEQARQQGELARQQDAQRRQSEAQQQSQRDQQRQQAQILQEQARQQQQQQQQQQRAAQQEQHRAQTQERQKPPAADAPEGERRRNREP